MESSTTDSELVAEMSDDEVTPSVPPPPEILRLLARDTAPLPAAKAASDEVFSAPTRQIAVRSNHRRRLVIAIAAAGALPLLLAVVIAASLGTGNPPHGAVPISKAPDEGAGYVAGKQIGARLSLPPPVPDTALDITSDPPGAEVFVDGEPALGPRGVLHTNVKIPGLPPGSHLIELKPSPAFKPWRQQVEIAAGAPARLTAHLAKLRRR